MTTITPKAKKKIEKLVGFSLFERFNFYDGFIIDNRADEIRIDKVIYTKEDKKYANFYMALDEENNVIPNYFKPYEGAKSQIIYLQRFQPSSFEIYDSIEDAKIVVKKIYDFELNRLKNKYAPMLEWQTSQL